MTRAAYKGFADTIRLLLFRDASQRRQDKDGMPSWPLVSICDCVNSQLCVLHVIILSLVLWFLVFGQALSPIYTFFKSFDLMLR